MTVITHINGIPKSTYYRHKKKLKEQGTIYGEPCPCGRGLRMKGQKECLVCKNSVDPTQLRDQLIRRKWE